MPKCLISVFSTTQIEKFGDSWFTEGDKCHLKLGQEVKSLSCSLKEGVDLSATAARRTHGSTGLNPWAPEGALYNLFPSGKCCYYNGKGQENKQKKPRQITYSTYWLQVCSIQSCILKDLGSPPWRWGTAHPQVHLQGFVCCYVQGDDERCFKICMFKICMFNVLH